MRTQFRSGPTNHRGARVTIPPPVKSVRCAIYVRQSVEDRTDNGFTSLDAQREAGEAFVRTMQGEGWVALPERYDDGGFTGGNTERPALKRLIQDIQDGKIDTLIVYKIDRLSRSLLDFLKLIEFFEQYNVAFVAVTQQINTATSAGKLMLHILASFASYERALISERTSDKMCAARRKGKWMGGPPPLGYKPDWEKKKLIVEPSEAAMVRELFDLYLQHRSLIDVCRVVNERGWTTKTTVYKNGVHKAGVAWNKARLYDILANVTYIGKVSHKGQLYDGEQDAIVDKRVFREVQKLLKDNSQNGGANVKNKHGALLRGLLKCGHCGSAMTHTYAKKGNRLYRYYMCNTRMKRGKDACPTPALPAQEIEDFVVEQIRKVAQDPELQRQVFDEVVRQQKKLIPKLEKEQKRLQREVQAKREEIKRLATAIGATETPVPSLTERLARLETVVTKLDGRVAEIDCELTAHRGSAASQESIANALSEFDAVWEVLSHIEQVQLIPGITESVSCGACGDVRIQFAHAAQ